MENKVTIYDVLKEINDKKDILKNINKIYLHWSAGRYYQFFSDYHLNILGDGSIIKTREFEEPPAATWCRNTNSIAICMSCAFQATSNNLGKYPPTTRQIETMARLIAGICKILKLPIDKNTVLTHGEAADNEDGEEITEKYGPKTTCERWDCEFLGIKESPKFNPWNESSRGGSILRGKAIWYYFHENIL